MTQHRAYSDWDRYVRLPFGKAFYTQFVEPNRYGLNEGESDVVFARYTSDDEPTGSLSTPFETLKDWSGETPPIPFDFTWNYISSVTFDSNANPFPSIPDTYVKAKGSSQSYPTYYNLQLKDRVDLEPKAGTLYGIESWRYDYSGTYPSIGIKDYQIFFQRQEVISIRLFDCQVDTKKPTYRKITGTAATTAKDCQSEDATQRTVDRDFDIDIANSEELFWENFYERDKVDRSSLSRAFPMPASIDNETIDLDNWEFQMPIDIKFGNDSQSNRFVMPIYSSYRNTFQWSVNGVIQPSDGNVQVLNRGNFLETRWGGGSFTNPTCTVQMADIELVTDFYCFKEAQDRDTIYDDYNYDTFLTHPDLEPFDPVKGGKVFGIVSHSYYRINGGNVTSITAVSDVSNADVAGWYETPTQGSHYYWIDTYSFGAFPYGNTPHTSLDRNIDDTSGSDTNNYRYSKKDNRDFQWRIPYTGDM